MKWLLCGGVLGLALTGATNLLVNPWRVLPQRTEVKSMDAFRDIDAEKRTCKAGLAMRGPWEVLIIGTSRPDSGIDPESPVFEVRPTVNLGLPGGDIYESSAMLKHALEYQHPQRALVLLDAGDLTRRGKIRIDSDFEISPLATGDPVERELRYVFSQRAMDSSLAAVKLWSRRNKSKHGSPAYSPFGLHHKETNLATFKNYYTILNGYLPWVGDLAEDQKRGQGIQADKVKLLRGMLDACAQHGVEMILAIPPNHLTITEALEEKGAPDPFFLKERRALAGIVAEANKAHPGLPCQLWDLNIPSMTTKEPYPLEDGVPMKDWLDPVHFNVLTGERYIGMMWGIRPDAELGIHVDTGNPDAYVAKVEGLFKAADGELVVEREKIRQAIVDKVPIVGKK